jgi:hypothetical protein
MTAATIDQVRAVVTTAGPDGASTFAWAGELTAVAAGRGTRVGANRTAATVRPAAQPTTPRACRPACSSSL